MVEDPFTDPSLLQTCIWLPRSWPRSSDESGINLAWRWGCVRVDEAPAASGGVEPEGENFRCTAQVAQVAPMSRVCRHRAVQP
jgi:hypothetical protein